MFRIGELSNICKVSSKTLRFYDSKGLLRPEYIDKATNYRYYSASQIQTLNEISLLKDAGFTLKEISALIKDRSNLNAKPFRNLLKKKNAEVDRQIRELYNKKRNIAFLEDAVCGIDNLSAFSVGIREIKKVQVASLKDTINSYVSQRELWKELLDYLEKCGTRLGPERYTRYYDSIYSNEPIQVEILKRVLEPFPETDRIKHKELHQYRSNTFAYLLHVGEHEDVENHYDTVISFIERNHFQITGCFQEEYYMDDFTTDNPNEFVTEIQIPINISN